MRVAALYDVHGNLPALEAVLADVDAQGVDEIVVGGDVLWGPMQVECIARLRDAGARFVVGNCERDVLQPTTEVADWCFDRLDDDTRSFVRSWPQTVERELDSLGRVVFCHATPRDVEEIVTVRTPDAAVHEALSDVDADVVVSGHTHVRLDRSVTGVPRLLNPGSVGLPYEGATGAFWALLDGGVELLRSDYDVEAALEVLAATGFPSFDDVFPESLRGLVSAESASAHFERRRGA
jgi:putative phosphoesterase